MIEIKDTRKTATSNPIPKMGDVVRIRTDYYICGMVDDEHSVLICLSDGKNWEPYKTSNKNSQYIFSPDDIEHEDIEVITNKITLTIE